MDRRSPITTHVLDLKTGIPAAGIPVTLEHHHGGKFVRMNESRTNQDGRCEALLPPDHKITTGTYRLIFVTGEYFKSQSETAFFPLVEITFNITDATRHHHVPLLLSPFGYSTYRGS